MWFQFNHHFADSDGIRRHLGALIVTVSPGGASRPLEVYRNPKWTRPNKSEILGEFHRTPDLSWEEFAALSKAVTTSNASVDEVDRVVNGPWHGIPVGGDEYSWSYREFWAWAAAIYKSTSLTVLGKVPQAGQYKVSARLIAYTPTPVPSSTSPVVFFINAVPGDTVFISLYSLYDGGQDTRSWFWVSVED